MNYNKIVNKVKKALQKNGNKCYIARESERVYNPLTNEYESEVSVVNGFAVQDTFDLRNINGTTVQIGDVNLMCYFDEVPSVNEKIHFGNKEYTIISITPLSPDGVVDLYYMIQAR